MNPQRKWGKVVMALLVSCVAFSGNRGLWNLYKLHQEKNNLSEQITQLRIEIHGYQSEYKAFEKNASTMEKQAREELDLVKPGEMVYKFKKSEN